jgi:hypothetical protein
VCSILAISDKKKSMMMDVINESKTDNKYLTGALELGKIMN